MERSRNSRNSSATEVGAGEKSAVKESDSAIASPKGVEATDEEKTQTPPEASADTPPDGGLTAWLQVVTSTLLFFNTWGLVNAFGVFQTYYDATLSRSPSDVAWIGTFQAFLLLCVAAVCGPLYDKGYLRHLLVTGAFLITFGMMMVSLSTEYYQVFLAQSVVVGLGSGCLQIPSLALPAQWFRRKRALAIGIAAMGGSLGAIIYPIVFRRLVDEISFGWATRVLGFITLGTLGVGGLLAKSRLPPSEHARSLFDKTALQNPAFLLLTFAILLYLMGVYMPFFYVSTWAQSQLGLDGDTSFYMFIIMNAGSVFGRVIPGLIADKLGPLNVLILTIMVSGIMIFAWISVSQLSHLIVFCIFYGFFSGASVSLPGSVIVGIAPELNKAGTWIGMCFSIASIGLLIGNPISGALIGTGSSMSFLASQCFAAASVLAGGICLCGLRYMKYKKGIAWKSPT